MTVYINNFTRKIIDCVLRQFLILSIYLEYYTNCQYSPTAVGTTTATLISNINDNNIPRATNVVFSSLVTQGDVCGLNRTSVLVYPTNCNGTVATGTVATLTASGVAGGYYYYCYYFVPSSTATHITLQFTFVTSGNAVIDIDNVQLNSTSDLIVNGDFQTLSSTFAVNPVPDPPWYITQCGTCNPTQATNCGVGGSVCFYAAGGNSITLTQTVAINTVGQLYVYLLAFQLDFSCLSQTCLVAVTLQTS